MLFSTTKSFAALIVAPLILLCSFLTGAQAQRLAFVSPPSENRNSKIEELIRTELSKEFKVLDESLAESVRENLPDYDFYNLTTDQAKTFGRAAGCNFFLVTKSATVRRASLARKNYWESYAVIYLVSSRSGRLNYWRLISAEADDAQTSEAKLLDSLKPAAREIASQIKSAENAEINENPPPKLAEPPPEDAPEAKNFRAPLPFRRLKPAYTELANFYGIAATIEAIVDLDEKGNVMRIEISRWAGYELDESVARVIRQMQWRAASRDGKALPVRVLLRYNFRKLESEN